MSKAVSLLQSPLYITISLLLVIVLLVPGCGEESSEPPIIFSITAEPDIIPPGETSTITVKAGDPDQDDLSYVWTAEDGQIQGDGKSIVWSSPATEGKYNLTVTVSDGVDSVTQTVGIWVWTPRQGDYYPLEIGNQWIFKDTEGNTINFEIIDTIDISGATAYVKQTKFSSADEPTYTYMAKNSDLISQHAMGGSNIGGDTLIFEPQLPIYKLPLVPGNSWEAEFTVWVPDGYYVGSGTTLSEVVSVEDLTVEAGTFQNVFKVKEDFTWELIGQEVIHILSYHWLAPNVGVVKLFQEQEVGGEIITTEASLKSYSLR